MANNENINVVMNEGVIDAAVQAVDAIPVKAENKFGVIGAVVLVGGIVITGIAMGIRHIKNKKKAEEEQAVSCADDIPVAKGDFEECDSTEE